MGEGEKMKKILFTDLDGTLLNGNKLVSEGNRDAIHRLLDAGHYLVIATGRPVKSGFKVAQKLGLTMPGCYMIAYNGAAIFDCAKEELCMIKSFPLEYARYIFEEGEKYGLYVQTYGEDDAIFAPYECEELDFYAKGNRNALDVKVCENVCDELGKDPNKVILINWKEERLLEFQRDHKEWERGKCQSVFSSKEFLEYLPLGVDKGSGVRALCELLQVPIENAYAAGDERNDISMIRSAGVGIAVSNALEEVKQAADYITENDNEHNAIAEVIYKLILK